MYGFPVGSTKVKVARYNHSHTGNWVVDYRDSTGSRRRKFFHTRAEALAKADQLKVELKNLGTRSLGLTDQIRIEALECSVKLASFGKILSEATDHYINFLLATERSTHIKDLVDRYLESKGSKGRSERHIRDLRSRLSRFAESFGESLVSVVTTKELDQWLAELDLSPQSINNYRTVLNGLFNYGLKLGYTQTNPVDGVERHSIKAVPPSILTPKHLEQLLLASDPLLVPYIAIGAFAGLRSAELDRLKWQDVRLDRGLIEVTAANSKTASRRLVHVSDNLRSWFQGHAKSEGPVAPLGCQKLFQKAWKTVFPSRKRDNDLRHSFASYHLALNQNAALTADQLGHRTTAVLYRHYRELVTKSEAQKYFAIAPERSDKLFILSAANS